MVGVERCCSFDGRGEGARGCDGNVGIRVACCVSRLEHHGSHSCLVRQRGVSGAIGAQDADMPGRETLKSHQICRSCPPVPSIPADAGALVDIRAGKKLVPCPGSRFSLVPFSAASATLQPSKNRVPLHELKESKFSMDPKRENRLKR